MFLGCGWAAWVMLLLFVVSSVLGLVGVALLIDRSRAAWLMGVSTLGVGVLIAGAGVGGEMWGRSATDASLPFRCADPSQLETIRRAGYADAAHCRTLGLFGSAVPLLGGLAVAFVGRARKRRRKDTASRPRP